MEQKLCQSCAMPMTDPEMFGTEKDGSRSKDYCKYCYTDGKFPNPDQTLEDMIKTCVPFMVEQGMPEKAARDQLTGILPRLKRWQK